MTLCSHTSKIIVQDNCERVCSVSCLLLPNNLEIKNVHHSKCFQLEHIYAFNFVLVIFTSSYVFSPILITYFVLYKFHDVYQ